MSIGNFMMLKNPTEVVLPNQQIAVIYPDGTIVNKTTGEKYISNFYKQQKSDNEFKLDLFQIGFIVLLLAGVFYVIRK